MYKKYAHLRGALLAMASIHLTEATGEEDGLDPLAPLAAGSARSIRTRKPADKRFAKLVACNITQKICDKTLH